MRNLTTAEAKEILERERRNALAREAQRRRWNNSAEGWAAEVEKNRRVAQEWHRTTGEWTWKRGPVEVLLRHSPYGLRMHVRVYDGSEIRVELARFDQALIFKHVRHALGNFGRETRDGGALVGLKMLYIGEDGLLRSPSRKTVWNGTTLTAEHPPTEDDRSGIYALWPARREPYRIYADLHTYHDLDRGVLARVLGTGRCVIGVKGWRAEHCVVTDLWTTPGRLHRLKRFQVMGVKTHDWDKTYGNR